MTPAKLHRAYEHTIARIVTSRAPVEALSAALADESVPGEVRTLLAHIDPRGLRLGALLVAKLRFERVIRGSAWADGWFTRDAAGFTSAFARYHAEVPPTAIFPAEEGRGFETFCSSLDSTTDGS